VDAIIVELARAPFVSEMEVINRVDEPELQTLYLKAQLIDGSELYIRETITPAFDKYSYHWQTADNQIICRWDNATHWPSVATYPHHRHVGSQENVQPSEHPTISAVIRYIAESLSATQA
jgi:hypothetical protein